MSDILNRAIARRAQLNATPNAQKVKRLEQALHRSQQRLAEQSALTDQYFQQQNIQRQKQEALEGFQDFGLDSDIGRTIVGSVQKGAATGFLEGPGRAGEILFGEGGAFTALKDIGRIASHNAQQTLDARNAFTLGEIAASTPQGGVGDILSGNVNLGEDPSLAGYGYQLLGILGEFAPQAASLVLKSPKAAAAIAGAIGGGQAGSAQATEQENYVRNLSFEELSSKSDMFNELVQNMAKEGEPTPDQLVQAREEVAKVAGKVAFGVGAAVGGAGGAATSYILRGMPKSLTKNFASQVGLSAAEEAVQEVGESIASRAAVDAVVGTDQDLDRDTFADLVLGGGFGGAIATPKAAVDSAGRGFAKLEKKAQERKAEKLRKAGNIDAAVEDGNYQQFVEKEEFATAATVIAERLKKEDISPDERAKLEEELPRIKDTLTEQITSAENQSGLADIDEVKRRQAAAEEAAAADPDSEDGKRESKVAQILARQVEALSQVPEEDRKNDVKRLKKRAEQLQQQKDAVEKILAARQATPEVAAEIETLKTQAGVTPATEGEAAPEPEVKQQAAKKIASLAMDNSENIDADTAKTVAEDSSNGLSDAERTHLKSFAQTQSALAQAKSLQQTSEGVYTGTDNFVGIKDRRERVAAAIKAGRLEDAEAQIDGVREFLRSHVSKKKAMQAAAAQSENTGRSVYIGRRGDNGAWTVLQGRRDYNQANGDLIIHSRGRSQALVQSVESEVQALRAAGIELKNAVAVAQDATTQTQQASEAPVTAPAQPQQEVPPVQEESDLTPPPVTEEPPVTDEPPPTEETPTRPDQPKEALSADITVPEAQGTVQPETKQQASTGVLRTFKEAARDLGGRVTDATYQSLNRLSQYMTQRANKDEEPGKSKPLVSVPNFLQQLTQDPENAAQYVAEKRLLAEDPETGNKSLDARQLSALEHFSVTVEEWNTHLRDKVIDALSGREFTFQNIAKELFHDGVVEENLLTAISAAAYSWVNDQASSKTHHDAEGINKLLGRDEEAHVFPKEWDAFRFVGQRRANVHKALGRNIVQALGIVARGTDTPKDLKANLEATLGAYAYQLLLDQGLLQETRMSGDEYRDNIVTPGEYYNPDAADQEEHVFAHGTLLEERDDLDATETGNLDPRFNRSEDVQEFREINKDTGSIVARLFDVESSERWPEFEVKPWNQDKTSPDTVVPERQKQVEEKRASYAWQLVKDGSLELWNALDPKIQLLIAGGVEIDKFTHADNKLNLEAKNDGLQREIDQLAAFQTLPDYQQSNNTFYLHGDVWVQQRVGLRANQLNPQSSKVHRSFAIMKDWVADVEVNPRKDSYKYFMWAVGLGLGVKADKQPLKKTIAETKAKFEDPAIKPAIDVLAEYLQSGTQPNAEGQQAILKAVKAAGEGMHSYSALLGAAQLRNAELGSTFSTSIFAEIDGVTNGPALTQAFLGAANTVDDLFEILNKAGFYREGEAKNFTDWKVVEDADGNRTNEDMYEDLAGDIRVAIAALIRDEYQSAQDDLEYQERLQARLASLSTFMSKNMEDSLVQSFVRNTVKTPFTSLNFGSAAEKAVQGMTDEFIQAIRDKIEAAAREDNDVARVAIINALNNLYEGHLTISQDTSFAELLELRLSGANLRPLETAFNDLLKEPITTVLKEKYDKTLKTRASLNQLSNAAFGVFDAIYKHQKRLFIRELQDRGELPYSIKKGQRVSRRDLSQKEEKALMERVVDSIPTVQTPLSLASLDDSGKPQPNAGMVGYNSANGLANIDVNPEYYQQVNFTPDGERDANSTIAKGAVRRLESPGVRLLVLLVHSADSAISSYATEKLASLNIHDANIMGVANAKRAGKNLNQATYEVLRDFSLPLSMVESARRVLQSFSQLTPEITQDRGFSETLRNSLDEQTLANLHTSYLKARNEALAAEILKLQALQEMAYVSQYAIPGGQYKVTDKDRALAKKREEQIRKLQARLKENDPALDAVKAIQSVAKTQSSRVNRASGIQPLEYANPTEIVAAVSQMIAKRFNAITKSGTKALPVAEDKILEQYRAFQDEYVRTGFVGEALKVVDKELQKTFINKLNDHVNVLGSQRRDIQKANAETLRDLVSQLAESFAGSTVAQSYSEESREALSHDLKELAKILGAIPPKEARKLRNPLNYALDQLVESEQQQSTGPMVERLLSLMYNADRDTQWGRAGTSIFKTNPSIQSLMDRLFSKREKLSADRVLKALMQHHRLAVQEVANRAQKGKATRDNKLDRLTRRGIEDTNLAEAEVKTLNRQNRFIREYAKEEFKSKLMKALLPIIDGNIEVRYVRPETEFDFGADFNQDLNKRSAWYDRKRKIIFVKSPEFLYSQLDENTLIHEFLHAALHGVIDMAQETEDGKRTGPANAVALVKDLENLLKLARGHVEQTYVDDKAGSLEHNRMLNATSSVHELVSWGMTDPTFQKKVLQQVHIKPSKESQSIISGLQKFVQSIVQYFFGRKPEGNPTFGMNMLLSHTSALIKEAEAHQKKIQEYVANQTYEDALAQSSEGNSRQKATAMSNEQVFEALASEAHPLAPEYAQHLRDVLANVVDKLHGPWGALAARYREEAAYTPEESFIQSLIDSGDTQLLLNIPQEFLVTDQESFVMEQVYQITLEALNQDVESRKELTNVFRMAREKLTPNDFLPAGVTAPSDVELARARRQYDLIFRTSTGSTQNTSDFLARFAAYGMAYRPLRDKLNFTVTTPQSPTFTGRVGDILKRLFNKFLDLLSSRPSGTYEGQKAAERVDNLVKNLVNAEARYVAKAQDKSDTLLDSLEAAAAEVGSKVRDGVAKAANSRIVRSDPSGLVKLPAALIAATAQDRVDETYEHFRNVLDPHFAGKRHGMLMDAVNEIRGDSPITKIGHKLLRAARKMQQARKEIKTRLAKDIIEGYDPALGLNLENLDKTQKREDAIKGLEALTETLLKTDISALLAQQEGEVGTFSIEDLTNMVGDNAALDAAIDGLSNQIKQKTPHYRHLITYGMDTAHHMIVGGNGVTPNVLLNAHNIVAGIGSPLKGKITGKLAEDLVPMVDRLISLYALKYAKRNNSAHVTRAHQIMVHELGRGAESGVLGTLLYHQRMKQDALEKAFEGQPHLVQKGYIKDITDPHVQIKAVTADQIEGLKAQGWEMKSELPKDPYEPKGSSVRYLMTRNAALVSRTTGIASLTTMKTAGTKLHGGFAGVDLDTAAIRHRLNNLKQQKAAKQVADLSKRDPATYDPFNEKAKYMVPVVNQNSEIVNFRHMMEEETKNALTRRDRRLDQVMGTMASNTLDKVESQINNKNMMDALRAQFNELGTRQPDSFIHVHPDSSDPEIVETWKLLPQATKEHIAKTWGQQGFYVHKDAYNMHFGFRKMSVMSVFEKDINERTMLEQYFTGAAEALLGDRAAVKLGKAEEIWENIARTVRDIWVIKNFVTFNGNNQSNVTTLLAYGVSPNNIRKDVAEGLRGILQYQKDSARLRTLESQRDSGYFRGTPAELVDEIQELTDAINRNPVKPLVDAGLTQSIIEDLDVEESGSMFQAEFEKKIQRAIDSLPKPLVTVGKTVAMTHDTPLYKFMYQATAQSDFVARYVLFQHLTKHSKKKVSPEQAIQEVDNAFVNYDIPTNKKLQKLNDMGFVPFTKYYLRIQKVLFNLYQKNPARMLGIALFGHYVDNVSVITDSNLLNKLDNLTSTGAGEIFTTWDDPITIQAAMSIVD